MCGWVAAQKAFESREVGYLVRAACDQPGCRARIDRGLGYRCGSGAPDTVTNLLDAALYGGCGGYFCEAHSARSQHACPASKHWGPEGGIGSGDDWLGCQTVGLGEESHHASEDVFDALLRGEDPACLECATVNR